MKKSNIFYYALGLMMAFSTASCSDDEVVKTQLAGPQVNETTKTVSSLSFEWEKVEGAVQYAYELYNPQDEVIYGDVTTANSLKFTGLLPSTTYTLKVWAFGAVNGDKTTSPTYVLQARTPDIVQLQAPVVTVDVTGPTVTLSWADVDNAAFYLYSCELTDNLSDDFDRYTFSNSVTLTGLTSGEYTFKIKSMPGDEAFAESEVATVTFQVQRQELWRVTGTFHSAYYQQYIDYGYNPDWDVVMVSYDDGSYSLINWMGGGDGYDLSFTVNSDSSISLLNTGEPWQDYQTVLYYPGYYMYYKPTDGGSKFTGNATAGSLYINEYYGTDTFTWGSTATEVSFTVYVTDSYVNSLYPAFTQKALKISDTEYRFTDFLNSGYDITITNDEKGNLHAVSNSDSYSIYYYANYYDQWLSGPFYMSNDKSESSYVNGFYLYVDSYSQWSQNCSAWWTGNPGFYLNCQFWFDSAWKNSAYGYIYFYLD